MLRPLVFTGSLGRHPRATREFNEKIASDPRLSAIVLPLMRERIDGLAIARVQRL